MSLTEQLRKYATRAGSLLQREALHPRPKPTRVLVLEQLPNSGWKSVEAEIGGASIDVIEARRLQNGRGPTFAQRSPMPQMVLIPDSRTSICRVLQVANAPSDQVKRMVALRLEVELPYPVAESTWVCEPLANGNGLASRALLIASKTAEIQNAEQELQRCGLRGSVNVEFGPGGLAELALSHGDSEGSVAALRLDASEAMLAIAHGRALCYSRHIYITPTTGDVDENPDVWLRRLAEEVRQSIYDFVLRTGHGAPDELVVTGDGTSSPEFSDILSELLGLPVRVAGYPRELQIMNAAAVDGHLMQDYPICVGALVALHRRIQGQSTATPALRRKQGLALLRDIDLRARGGTLLALNAAALLLLIAATYSGHFVRMSAAEDLIAESKPALPSLVGLQEEVDILEYESKRQRSMLDIMLVLTDTLPPGIKIESLGIDAKGKVTIGGKTSSVELISTAIAALEDASEFINPVFHGATRENDALGFQITCEVRGGVRAPA